jgi:CheY-like chemotaxis protein
MYRRHGFVEDRSARPGKEQPARQPADLQKRYDALVREHADLRREHDKLAHRLATVPRSSSDAAAQLAQAQKAILSIRQARDSVVAQNHELTNRLSRAENQLAKLGYEHDSAERARAAAVQQAQELARECDELRRKALDLTEEKFAVLESGKDHSSALVTALQQVAVLTEERHLTRHAAAEQKRETDELRAELEALRNAPPRGSGQLELEDARHKLADLEAQMEGFKTQQRKNVLTLTKHLEAERDALRKKVEEEKSGLHAQIKALQEELANHHDGALLGQRLEQQRLVNLEIATQLEAARQELQQLRATQAAPAAEPAAKKIGKAGAPNEKSAKEPNREAAPTTGVEPLTVHDASVTLGAMNSCLEMLRDHPGSVELLEELDSHLLGFSERARRSGYAAVHRLSTASGELTRWLRKSPAKISPATLHPLEEAIQLLSALTSLNNPAQIADPTDALVYAVDDDPDNCECIAMALEKINLRTKYSLKPEVALSALATTPCDLILLDVDLPGMDGFELSLRIRQIERHVATPIVFLSALTSTKDRLASNPNGANDFIAKPYNLNELGLKALTLILKTRLTEPAACAA